MVTTSLTTFTLINDEIKDFSEETRYAVQILDTGEDYILTLDSPFLKLAMNMYEIMGITITLIDTNMHTSMKAMNFVYKTLGHVFSNGFTDNNPNAYIDIPTRLKKDISRVLETYDIITLWDDSRYKYLPQPQQCEVSSNYDFTSFRQQSTTNQPCVFYNAIYNLCFVYTPPSTSFHKAINNAFPEFHLVFELPIDTSNDALSVIHNLFHLK